MIIFFCLLHIDSFLPFGQCWSTLMRFYLQLHINYSSSPWYQGHPSIKCHITKLMSLILELRMQIVNLIYQQCWWATYTHVWTLYFHLHTLHCLSQIVFSHDEATDVLNLILKAWTVQDIGQTQWSSYLPFPSFSFFKLLVGPISCVISNQRAEWLRKRALWHSAAVFFLFVKCDYNMFCNFVPFKIVDKFTFPCKECIFFSFVSFFFYLHKWKCVFYVMFSLCKSVLQVLNAFLWWNCK